jgi:hypothetical protein
MLDYSGVEKTQTPKLNHLPNVSSLLKISLGLIFFTLLSTALVYAETVPLIIDGNSFDIEYTIDGASISGIEQLDSVSLLIDVEMTDPSGTLEIIFERSVFDSIFNGEDDAFFVLSDGEELTSTETQTNSVSRTLSIELPASATEVEIIGSIFINSVIAEDSTAADKAAADKAAADKAAADKAAADKAAADKAAASTTTATQCGPGTILKDGACVLDERCGPGTIFEDGTCVLDSTPQPTTSSVKGLGKDLMMGLIAAIAVAGVVGIILGIISKASKSND